MRTTSPHAWRIRIVLLALVVSTPAALICQQPAANQFPGLKWRLIGPFRGGRVTAVAGIPGDPRTYYFGTPGGGIWKTTNGARVWTAISDQVRVPSIGALAVAPSNPKVIYAGTGEQTRGKGMYRSSDGGATWASAGLQDNPYIQAVLVDPHNPDIVVVGTNAVGFQILWRPLPKSTASNNRGILRTEDGGKTWKKVYASDANLGVVDMCADPDNPSTIYAAVYVPETSGAKSEAMSNSSDKPDAPNSSAKPEKPEETPPTSEIIKSTDGGATWSPLATKGLPEKGRGRLG